MDNLVQKHFSDIELSDPFFDNLRDNYPGFNDWFKKKATSGARAYVYYNEGRIIDFLYLKVENEPLTLIEGVQPAKRRLKIGTFKIEHRGTSRGERFIKRALDEAIKEDCEEIYVTMFDDTEELKFLKKFFQKFGFIERGHIQHSNGRRECVLIRLPKTISGDIIKDYPYVDLKEGDKYVLSIYPTYHTKLFSDSILKTEKFEILKDVSETNSIYKIYVCWMQGVSNLKKGDKLIIYRTSDQKGPALYRSVASSLCTVYEVRTNHDFEGEEAFISYCNKYSVFNSSDLSKWYRADNTCYVIKMLYNVAFGKKVIRKDMIELAKVPTNMYWGFFKLTDSQFNTISRLGEVDERYIID